MGLTKRSTGLHAMDESLMISKTNGNEKTVALAGNPNVGKSTVFNSLTGMKQHTGNWPGKTVGNAVGRCKYRDAEFIMVDIPGTYSLFANSEEEEVARDYICFGKPDVTVIVADATNLERNLNLLIQTCEITDNVVLCVNLIDEAKRKGIYVDADRLSSELGIPVVKTSAGKNEGLDELKEAIYKVSAGETVPSPIEMDYGSAINGAVDLLAPLIRERIAEANARWLALRLLENDADLIKTASEKLNIDFNDGIIMQKVSDMRAMLSDIGLGAQELKDRIACVLVTESERIASESVTRTENEKTFRDRRIDRILTSKKYGIPIMILLLMFVMWLTVIGANYPSRLLSKLLFGFQDILSGFLMSLGASEAIEGLLVQGMYKTLAWVVAVMLPPMAIFFPLFTLLEDLGYLPRIAFNLDNYFKKACACGKQALTMCMGFGCNAAGVVGCRIIDSPRERLIAIITNSFVPCNGRFPTMIAVISMFFAGAVASPVQGAASAAMLASVIILGIFMTLAVSRLLSKTLLKGVPSSFTLELPPYRKPQIGKLLVRSVFDRTLFVLGRAASVAAPAGAVIWIMANVTVGDATLLTLCASFLDPFAHMIGMDGYILMAFVLGFPANEIVFPIIIMSYMSAGSLLDISDLGELRMLLISNGWSLRTAVCVMLFSLMHWPCSTTCLTIHKETQSLKWSALSVAIPTLCGFILCFAVTLITNLFF